MKKLTKLLALILSMIIILCSCADSMSETVDNSGAKELDYLNLDSPYPIINEDADPIELKVVFAVSEESGEWDDLWISKYLKDKYNINLDVELIRGNTAKNERKSLMLNSGDLPDMIWNMNLSTSEIVKYGTEEGLFLKLDEYMSEELTPGIMSYWSDRVRKLCTTPDGHVYTLPMLSDSIDIQPVTDGRMFINKAVLSSLGLEIPRTLDEFVDTMYKVKAADPNHVGSENFYPMGAGIENPFTSVFWYMLNAFGYNTVDVFGLAPCLRDDNVVIPAYDSDTYYEYLSLMHQLYADGIINPDVFTIDSTGIDAMMNAGETLLYANAPFVSGIETWDEWESCYPLTSTWQLTPEAISPDTVSVGGFVISADTKYPELCMRIADIFFNNKTDYCAALWGGTGEGTEYDYEGYVLYAWDEDKQAWALDESLLPEGQSVWSYHLKYLNGAMPAFGAYDLEESRVRLCNSLGGNLSDEFAPDYSTGEGHFTATTFYNMAPYAVDTYPSIYYVDESTTQRILDIETVVKPYVKEQVAQFITGNRDLSEFDDYRGELEAMGMNELLDIYKEIYTVYNQQ